MKKFIFSITAALLIMIMPAAANDYDEIRENALFLTDKMAYELNLTEEQYEAAYEINFDYLYEILSDDDFDYDDVYGRAWKSRNRDLRIILLDSQYNRYKRLKYFYHPFHHSHGKITIRIYNYYPRRDYLYFGCPNFVISYRGGHGWRHYRNHSYYSGRAWHKNVCYGMRDGYRDGHRYYHNNTHHHSYGRYYRDRHCHDSFRNTNNRGRVSSTRTTVNNGNEGFGKSRTNIDRERRLPDNKFSPRNNQNNRSRNINRSRTNKDNNDNTNNSDRRGRFGGGR